MYDTFCSGLALCVVLLDIMYGLSPLASLDFNLEQTSSIASGDLENFSDLYYYDLVKVAARARLRVQIFFKFFVWGAGTLNQSMTFYVKVVHTCTQIIHSGK